VRFKKKARQTSELTGKNDESGWDAYRGIRAPSAAAWTQTKRVPWTQLTKSDPKSSKTRRHHGNENSPKKKGEYWGTPSREKPKRKTKKKKPLASMGKDRSHGQVEKAKE